MLLTASGSGYAKRAYPLREHLLIRFRGLDNGRNGRFSRGLNKAHAAFLLVSWCKFHLSECLDKMGYLLTD